MDISESVKNALIFKTLDENQIEKVLNITREIRVYHGDVIMQEGDEGSTMYMIVQGEVGVSKSLTMKFGDDDFRQAEKVLNRFRHEDHVIFGEMALIGNDTRSATIMARSDCVLAEINREDFIRLVQGEPELGVKVLLNLSQLLVNRLRESGQNVIRLTTALSIALSK